MFGIRLAPFLFSKINCLFRAASAAPTFRPTHSCCYADKSVRHEIGEKSLVRSPLCAGGCWWGTLNVQHTHIFVFVLECFYLSTATCNGWQSVHLCFDRLKNAENSKTRRRTHMHVGMCMFFFVCVCFKVWGIFKYLCISVRVHRSSSAKLFRKIAQLKASIHTFYTDKTPHP